MTVLGVLELLSFNRCVPDVCCVPGTAIPEGLLEGGWRGTGSGFWRVESVLQAPLQDFPYHFESPRLETWALGSGIDEL